MALTKTPSELTAADITITTAAQPNITSLGTLTTLTIDDITINGSTISDAADLTIDAGGDIILDADGGDVNFKDGGTLYGFMAKSNNDLYFGNAISDGDVLVRGNDGGSNITALSFDMSAAGAATFNDKVIADSFESTAGGTFTTASGNDLNIVYPDSRSLFIKEGSTTHAAVDNAGIVIIGGTTVHESRVNQNFALTHAAQRGGMMINSFYNSAAGPIFDWNKSRNDTAGSHTVVQNGDALGTFIWRGDDGDEFVDSIAIEGNVDGPPGNGDMPGRLVFYTSPDGTGGLAENMRINSAGNVGIGDTVPAWGVAYRALTIGSSGSIWCSRSGTSLTAIGDNMYFDGTNNKARNTQAGAMYYMNAGSHVWQHAPSVSAGANQTFSTKMMINTSGSLLIGKSTDDVDTDGAVIIGAGGIYSSVNSSTYNTYHYRDTSSNSYKFYVAGSGQVNSTFTSIAQISDARLKENVRDYTVGLNDILKLKPRVFDWKEHQGKDKKNDVGFIAQEFEEVFPDWVSNFLHDDLDDAKTVSANELIYPMVNAIKTLSAEIESLKAEVKALKEA